MNPIKLLILSAVAAFVPPLRSRYSTANGGNPAAEVADLQTQFTALQKTVTDQAETIATLTAAAKTAAAKPLAPLNSQTELLAKGANVPLEDVRWRVAQGLTPQQAVQAASLQVARDKSTAAANKNAKAAKAKG
jgi:hypothetical protein